MKNRTIKGEKKINKKYEKRGEKKEERTKKEHH